MSGFTVDIDLGNPGQLFACCGLLEASHRLWRDRADVTGHFDEKRFHVEAPGGLHELLRWLGSARVDAITTPGQKRKKKRKKNGPEDTADERGDPERASPITLSWAGESKRLYLDSWSDCDFGRTTIKTFAGQQSSAEIAKWLTASLGDMASLNDLSKILDYPVSRSKGDKKGFGFDQRKGRSALDIGFSLKETKIPADEFPATEILAAIGVQSHRPKQSDDGTLVFGVWTQPLPVELARAAAGCAFAPPGLRRFRFRLLGRKERSGVAGATNDHYYKTFTRTEEI